MISRGRRLSWCGARGGPKGRPTWLIGCACMHALATRHLHSNGSQTYTGPLLLDTSAISCCSYAGNKQGSTDLPVRPPLCNARLPGVCSVLV